VIVLIRALEERLRTREEMSFPVGKYGRCNLMLTAELNATLGPRQQF
jgi:hypothetical protein